MMIEKCDFPIKRDVKTDVLRYDPHCIEQW